jgi:hypothetical protein
MLSIDTCSVYFVKFHRKAEQTGKRELRNEDWREDDKEGGTDESDKIRKRKHNLKN